MNLVSCSECGIVLNKDILIFDDAVLDEEESLFPETAIYDDGIFILTTECPLCKGRIREDGEPVD